MVSCTDSAGITCSICDEVYNSEERRPLLLPCSHTFCRNCLRQMQKNQNALCPFCRASWSGQSIEKLPYIRQLADASKNIQSKKFKSTLDERTCIPHCADMVLWCKNCEVSICSRCLIERHKTCDWIPIEEKTTDLLKNLHRSAATTRTKLDENFKTLTFRNNSQLTNIRTYIKKLQHYEKITISFANQLSVEHEIATEKLDEYDSIPKGSSVPVILSTISEIESLLDEPMEVPIIPNFMMQEYEKPVEIINSPVHTTDNTHSEICLEESSHASGSNAALPTSLHMVIKIYNCRLHPLFRILLL